MSFNCDWQENDSLLANPTIGVFAGIFDFKGRIGVVEVKNGKHNGELMLPGGGVSAHNVIKAFDERIIFQELAQILKEKMGVSLSMPVLLPPMFPAITRGGSNLALAIPLAAIKKPPKNRGMKYIASGELRENAENLPKNRILGGWGKQMHRLILRLLAESPNPRIAREAGKMLEEIHIMNDKQEF